MLAFGVCVTLIENLSGFDVNDAHQLDGSKSFLTLSFSCPSCQMSYFEYMDILMDQVLMFNFEFVEI